MGTVASLRTRGPCPPTHPTPVSQDAAGATQVERPSIRPLLYQMLVVARRAQRSWGDEPRFWGAGAFSFCERAFP